jgi:hypothetical protein
MLRSVRRVSRSRRRDSGCREAELQGMMKYTFRTNAHCSSRVSCATFFRATWGGRPVSRPEKTLAGILGRVSYGSKTLVQAPARAFRCLICFTLFIGLVHGMQNVQSPTIFFSNTTVYTSCATLFGVTQLLVAPRSLVRPKGLVFGKIYSLGELFLKF